MDQVESTPSITKDQADEIRDAVLSAASDGRDVTGLAAGIIAEFEAVKAAERGAESAQSAKMDEVKIRRQILLPGTKVCVGGGRLVTLADETVILVDDSAFDGQRDYAICNPSRGCR